MDKKRTVQRGGRKNAGRPKVRFNFGILISIFLISFLACFGLYMTAANINDDFFSDTIADTETEKKADTTQPASAGETEGEEATEAAPAVTNPVPQSAAADASYFESCCLITDPLLLQMGDLGSIPAQNVFGNSQLNAVNCMNTKVESTFGTVAVYDIVKLKKPANVYIMLGNDIGTASPDEMIASYTTLVNNLHGALPDTNIYIMQIPPMDAEINDKVNEYNNRLLAMANTLGVYCIDTNTALKNETGTIKSEYWSDESRSLTEEGYKTVCGYILTHTV